MNAVVLGPEKEKQFLPKSHSHLFCLYIGCCIIWRPRSGVNCYKFSYLQRCRWECQGIPWCSTCLNFRGNKYKIPLDTIKTSGLDNAELVLSLKDSLHFAIFSGVACLIFLSIFLQKDRNKSMIMFLCVLVALLHSRKRWVRMLLHAASCVRQSSLKAVLVSTKLAKNRQNTAWNTLG